MNVFQSKLSNRVVVGRGFPQLHEVDDWQQLLGDDAAFYLDALKSKTLKWGDKFMKAYEVDGFVILEHITPSFWYRFSFLSGNP